jgi:putative ABC transport system substrate-binding protein
MRLRTIGLILALALGVFLVPLTADAQQAGKVCRIGVLWTRGPVPHLDGILPQALRELGYVEGRNIIIERRYAEGRAERLPDLAAELVRLKPDVIVATATAATQAAKNATKTIPIVMVAVLDPVGTGLIASLARPGGNITGLTFLAGLEIVGKTLQLLKEAVPGIRRVAVLWNPTHPTHQVALQELKAAARVLGVELQPLGARGPDEFDSAFSAMARERADALLVMPETIFVQHRIRLADFAAKHRLPAMHAVREHAEAGGLMAYAPNVVEIVRHAAIFVDKILKGAKPADLPVEQPTKFELVINMKTAKALGLTIPQSVLFRADQVIQ